MDEIKKFFKELKRTRWPSSKEIKNNYWKVIVFIAIFALVIYALSIGLIAMWDSLGVGL